jgi:AcrR family transcriptional regulator
MSDDPRRARSRARVVETAVEVLREHGAQGLSIEAVAARSGVAKTTIYRQFSGREELHAAALAAAAWPIEIAATDDLLADVTVFIHAIDSGLRSEELAAVLATAIDGAERSPALAAILAGEATGRRAALVGRLQAAQGSGQLAAEADVDLLHAQLVGPIFFRRFMSRQATGRKWVAALVGSVLRPWLRPGDGAAGSPGGAATR